jgi:hypothetical protein
MFVRLSQLTNHAFEISHCGRSGVTDLSSDTKRTIGLSFAVLILTCTLTSCATIRAATSERNSLNDLIVDPMECTKVSLKQSVAVYREIIHEPSIMGNKFLLVLRYREGGDEKEYAPYLSTGYNNVSLVSVVGTSVDPIVVYRRYCVIEMWKFDPEKNIKNCYLWTIGDDSASMKVMMEDLGGQLIDERTIDIDAQDIAKLTTFCKNLSKDLMDMLKEPAPET